ncbi:polysaccharide deacetylase family protein [Sphingomonas sp. AR_OL41]|uniref:polysaccharide deacetylase family protein n=1 Tax=Sphingomonas sp. AR_OL41 TaxID=3042729 RepID=UPI0024806F0A|nr:polysaccharide deacetylase family protein [Sphingomonas sp. AR_OL41]MDH7974123.1 polysaccharide deacetylase family protein [Sphingomonas sp. AR_OL41]
MATPAAPETGYVVPPPDPATLVVWPDDFGTRFTVFVDTEEEFDWHAPLSRDAHGTSAVAALPAAHRRFADHGVPLTFMVDYPIATDPRAVEALRAALADGVSAVGTQLHAWVNPPFDEPLSPANSYAGNLPIALEAAKLDALGDAITTAFGAAPRVYRAGRYGIGPATLSLLAARGYRIDSSMRARYSYAADGGPDFGAIGNQAFRVGDMVELPLTTMFTGSAARGGARLYAWLGAVPKGRGLFARAGLLSRVALTPEDMPLDDALEAVAVAIGEGVRVLNFSFHSPSLVPGHTPYVRDTADLSAFHRWWDRILADLARRGVRAAALDELIAASAALPATPTIR